MQTNTVLPRTGRAKARLALVMSAVALLGSGIAAAVPASAAAGRNAGVETLRDVDAARLAKSLAGPGVKVSDASFVGADVQGGLFKVGAFGKHIGVGVALSSGSLIDADPQADSDVDFTESSLLGPNTSLTTTGDFGGAGDQALTDLAGATSYDAAVLTFTAVPKHSKLRLVYLFGSEEYANWSAQGWNDSLGIWIGDQLCSLVPGTSDPAGIPTINETTNSQYYIPNFEGREPGTTYDTEANAFTKPLTCTADVTPREPVTVKIAVGDTRDGHLDSTLLVVAKSLWSTRR